MKMKCFMAFAAFAIIGNVGAESLNKASCWRPKSAVTEKDGTLIVAKRTKIVGKRFTVDPAKKYTFKFTASVSDDPKNQGSWVLGGFDTYDKNGKFIRYCNVVMFNSSIAEVVADAAAGSTELTLKNAASFKVLPSAALVLNAKADLSDLPNFNVISKLKKIEKSGDVWKATLAAPLRKAIKAGTKVREHRQGGYFYSSGIKTVRGNEVKFSGTVSGINKKSSWPSNVWPIGTASASPMIMVDWHNKGVKTVLSNIELIVE